VKTPSTIPAQPAGALHDTARSLRHVLQSILGCLTMGLAATILLRDLRALEIAAIVGLLLAGACMVGRVALDVVIEAAEVITQRDFNSDGVIGEQRPITVNRQPIETGIELWERFVKQAVHKSDERALLRQGFDDTQIGVGRDALIRWGLAAWRSTDRRHGWDIKEGVDAEAILRSLPYCDLDDDNGA
jgi:hypothetical protein